MEPLWLYKPYKLAGIDLFDLLQAYSVRQLSFPADTLNAMLGILQLLAERKDKPIYHVCGVPLLNPTNDKFDSDSDSDGDSSTLTAHLALDGFVNGLCWRLQEPACRRPNFPS